MIRSILAVVVGYLFTFAGVAVFFAFAIFALGGMPSDPAAFKPPTWLVVAELVWAPLPALAGGFVCAWIARRHPMRHAAALAGLLAVLGVLSAVAEGAGHKPWWSAVALVLLGVAGALAGGRLRLDRA